MATIKVVVVTCDRHGGEIKHTEQFLHFDVTPGGKAPGRKSHQVFDLCEACMQDFLKFLEGEARG
jgi:hypothetical protein